MANNIIRAEVTIQGTRTLLQHQFGPDSIPLEGREKTGVAGNDPEEWKRTCMVTEQGQLYLPGTYVFSCLKNGAVHTKMGRGSIQSRVVATLQVEEDVILLDRWKILQLKMERVLTPLDPEILVFVNVSTVRNPATKGRNVRYRLATRAGWKCKFTLNWDKTVVSREQMRAVLEDSGKLGGLGDGIRIGCGRFDVVSYKELAEEPEVSANGKEERKAAKVGR